MSWLPDWLTGYDAANAAAVNERQAELARREAEARANGNAMLADYYAGGLGQGASASDDRAAIDTEFGQAVKDNASAISQGINDTLTYSLGKILGAVPWWLWLAAGFGLFLYLGGGAVIRKQIAKLS